MSARARLHEETVYEQVAAEITAGIRREGLWAKALADAGGSPEFARAAYIKLRAQSLFDEDELREAAAREKTAKIAEMERRLELDAINFRVDELKKQRLAEHREVSRGLMVATVRLFFGILALALSIGLAAVLALVLQGNFRMLSIVIPLSVALWWVVRKLR